MTGIRLCVAGATGRMGSTLIREACSRSFKVVGALAAPTDPNIGRSLRELGVCDSDVAVVDSSKLAEALREADIYMSFTTPEAEVQNIPVAAGHGKKVLMGTTGLSEGQWRIVREAVSGKVPAVFSSNFSIGINILMKIIEACRLFPRGYDFTLFEAHHSGKVDAPSGTALKMSEVVSSIRGYRETVFGRKGIGKRKEGELEVLSARAGGIPGVHELIIAGQHEMIRIEHTAFSRTVFAQGVLYAAEWLHKVSEPRIYTMDDVLSQMISEQ